MTRAYRAKLVGRELRRISTAQMYIEVPAEKVLDAMGCPLIVSAVVTFKFTSPANTSLAWAAFCLFSQDTRNARAAFLCACVCLSLPGVRVFAAFRLLNTFDPKRYVMMQAKATLKQTCALFPYDSQTLDGETSGFSSKTQRVVPNSGFEKGGNYRDATPS